MTRSMEAKHWKEVKKSLQQAQGVECTDPNRPPQILYAHPPVLDLFVRLPEIQIAELVHRNFSQSSMLLLMWNLKHQLTADA